MTLRTFIELHYKSFSKMDREMDWTNMTANRYYNSTPHMFLYKMDDISKHTGVEFYDLTKMIVDRIVELREVQNHKTIVNGL